MGGDDLMSRFGEVIGVCRCVSLVGDRIRRILREQRAPDLHDNRQVRIFGRPLSSLSVEDSGFWGAGLPGLVSKVRSFFLAALTKLMHGEDSRSDLEEPR